MRSDSIGIHGSALLALTVAAAVMFWRVLETPFWSPEDFNFLQSAVDATVQGTLLQWKPTLAGGYSVNPLLALEFHLFGLEARPYLLVNLAIHIVNAYLAFLLVHSLLHDRLGAFIAALLFAITVGSYGKNLMFVAGSSSLVYAGCVLLAMLLYVQNEKRNAGRPVGRWALGFFLVFLASLFMRGGTFSILGAVFVYNVFFLAERRRPILHTNLKVALVLAVLSIVANALFGGESVTAGVDAGAFLLNLPGYLILMVLPLQQSQLLTDAPWPVQWLYRIAPVLRVLVGLAILSYSLIGFVFGNRAIRFYIAWMYVMIVPFTLFRYPADWLNLRFLYLVSLGFCVLLTTGTLYAYRLLRARRVRRFLPFIVPVLYIIASGFLVQQLNRKNLELSASPGASRLRAAMQASLAAADTP
jgi:hypothetical protein